MAYKLKTRDEFKKYLDEEVKIIPSHDEDLINEFNSSSLFDLYGLLKEIENDLRISTNMQEKLKDTVKAQFPKEVYSLISFPINDEVLKNFEEYIKDKFIDYMEHPEKYKGQKEKLEEIEKLKIIIAKRYPNEFLKFIKTEKDPKDLKLEVKYIKKQFYHTLDKYMQHKKNMQNNEDIQTATYTTIKNDFGEFDIYLPGRVKSLGSATENYNKELHNSLDNIVPSDLEKGITYEDLENNFNLDKTSDDYFAITIVLKNVLDTFHIDELESLYNAADDKTAKNIRDLIQYRRDKNVHLSYYHSLKNFIDDPYFFMDFTQEQYLQIKIELLDILQRCTFSECSEEYNGPLFKPQNKDDLRNFFFKTT